MAVCFLKKQFENVKLAPFMLVLKFRLGTLGSFDVFGRYVSDVQIAGHVRSLFGTFFFMFPEDDF